MKKLFNIVLDITREFGLAVLGAGAVFARWLRGASWQRLLGCALLGAFLLAIVPAALVLFLIFLALKAVVVALVAPAKTEAPLQLDYTPTRGEEK
jgi:hypothetical protein